MESVWNVAVFEEPAFLLGLKHRKPRHVGIPVHTIGRASMHATKIDLRLSDFLIEINSALYAKRFVHGLVNSCVNLRVKERTSSLLIPQHTRSVGRETQRHPLNLWARIS